MRSLVFVAILVLVGCKRNEGGGARQVVAEGQAPSSAAPPVTAMLGDGARVTLMIYYRPRPTAPPLEVFAALVAKEPDLEVIDAITTAVTGPTVYVEEPAVDSVPLADAASLKAHFSKGLTDAEIAALGGTQAVVALVFTAPSAAASAQLGRAYRLAGELAGRTGGLVWSDDARTLYGADAWRERVAAVTVVPPRGDHVMVSHAYHPEGGSGLRIVSLGMLQLALPDLVIEDVPRAEMARAGWMLELVAQHLIEGAQPDVAGELELDIGALRGPASRARFQAEIGDGGAGKARVRLVIGEREEGDAENRLARIDFLGTTPYHERLAATGAAIFGRTDEMVGAQADDVELTAARDRARVRLAALQPRFAAGLGDRVTLIVKAPFRTTSGSAEYMWLEVRRWQGGVIRGVLTDEPFEVPDLHAGATVEVQQAEIYDYQLSGPDGPLEGGETTEILLRRQGDRGK